MNRDVSNYKYLVIDRTHLLSNQLENRKAIPEGSTHSDVMTQMVEFVGEIVRTWTEFGVGHISEEWHPSGLFCNLYTIYGKSLVGVSFS